MTSFSGILSDKFLRDIDRGEYKVDGKAIPSAREDITNPSERRDFKLNKFEEAVPDLAKRQLISAYANQSLFSDPSIRILSANNLQGKFVFDSDPDSKILKYKIKNSDKDEMKLTAKYEAKLQAIDPDNLEPRDKVYSSTGMKIKMILSENQLPQPEYSYFLKEKSSLSRSLNNSLGSLGCVRWC